MTDIINLNSIRSDNCDCNKPKPKENSCGCHNHKPQPCYLAVDLSDLYFKVKNLFGELKSEWQRAEARSNLGIIDILKLELTKESLESGGTNEWTMTTLKGGVTSIYKFYVKNGLKGETGPLGKSAYDIYCETTTDYPVKTEAQWLGSLKGETGDVGPAGMSAYELAQKLRAAALLPTQSIEEWLLSLKGEKGDKGDSGDGEGDKIISVTLVNPPTTIPENTYVWRITLKSGQTFDLWTPKEGGGGESPSAPSGMPTIMYQKIHYDYTPTETELSDKLELLQLSVNRNNLGKTIDELEALGWTTYAGVVRENDFVFMASTIITDDYINLWQVVRLTPLPGKDGTGGGGHNGQFTSVVFTRTNTDISELKPSGGDYDNPLPYPNIQQIPGTDEFILWSDGIPDGTKQLWASSRVFGGQTDAGWTKAKRMTDTTTYDVEFARKYSVGDNEDATPPPPDKTNSGVNPTETKIWYDPKNDASADFTNMYWRAEREYKNGEWGNWIIMRIKGERGEQGPEGPQGPEGHGGNGTGTLGLTGPVIRMRGEWQENANPCYVNESLLLLELDRIRFIDVVFYLNNYYMVKNTTNGDCVPSVPTNTNDWEPASAFNFAYIQTLVTQYLSNYSLDTEEIRIHSRSTNPASDIIVAGMTSGKQAVEGETNNAGDVRIWAGSSVNVLNQTNGLYQLNVQGAPFRVTQEGDLFAEKADIEGTVLANILRLGEKSFSTCDSADDPDLIGKPLESGNLTLILPALTTNKVQMFYLLTDTLSHDITVYRANTSDSITYFDAETLVKVSGQSSVPVSPNRLYLFFGINHEWRVCEATLAPVTVVATTTDGGIVDPSYYQVNCFWTIKDYLIDVPNNNYKRLGIKGLMELNVTNNYTSDITLHIADVPLHVTWKDTQDYPVYYDIKITTNGLVAPVGQTTSISLEYDKEHHPPILDNNGFVILLENYDNLIGLTDVLYANGPTITINSTNISENEVETFLQFVGNSNGYKYKFLSPLISATYHRAPGQTTLTSSSPTPEDPTGGLEGVWLPTDQFTIDFSPGIIIGSRKVSGISYGYIDVIEFEMEDVNLPGAETALSNFTLLNTSLSENIALTFPDERRIYIYIKYKRTFQTGTSTDCFFYGGYLNFVFNGGNDNCNCNDFIISPNTTWEATKELNSNANKLLCTFNDSYLFTMEFINNNASFILGQVRNIDELYYSYTYFDELRVPKTVDQFEHLNELISSTHFSIPEVAGLTSRKISSNTISQLLTLNNQNN